MHQRNRKLILLVFGEVTIFSKLPNPLVVGLVPTGEMKFIVIELGMSQEDDGGVPLCALAHIIREAATEIFNESTNPCIGIMAQ